MMTPQDEGLRVVRERLDTALGVFVIEASARGLRAVSPVMGARSRNVARALGAMPGSAGAHAREHDDQAARAHLRSAADALRRYAQGEPACYQGPLDVSATAFHRAVWERLRAIPFGATTTYGRIAADLGVPGEAQAVGAAVGANPIALLVPCHRVVGADGSLRGFAWGLGLKRRLLAHEGSATLSLLGGVSGS